MASILSDLFTPKNGYTLGEIMTIDPQRQERSMMCSVSLLDTYHEIKKSTLLDKFRAFFSGKSLVNMYYVIFRFQVTSDSGHKHTVIIKCSPDFNLTEWTNNRVQIYCDCFDFKFRSAYLLNRGDALFLTDRTKMSLGESVTKAPKSNTRTTFLCKHAFAACQWLINNYSNIMRTI